MKRRWLVLLAAVVALLIIAILGWLRNTLKEL